MHTYGAVCCVHCSVDDGTTVAPDEKTCGSDEFTCGDGTCIPLSQRCDWTEYHCPDGTDEFDCRTLFTLKYFFAGDVGKWSIVMCMSVLFSLSDCPFICEHISRHARPISTKFLCMFATGEQSQDHR